MKTKTITTQTGKLCKVVRIQKKPFYGVLKQHKQFRVVGGDKKC